MEKKIRFGDLVRNSGRPQVMTLWTDPSRTPSFRQAVKQNRVLTVIQEPTSTHKDFGRIGFDEQPYAIYLIFPQRLPEEKDARVIGMNYALLEQPLASKAAPQRKSSSSKAHLRQTSSVPPPTHRAPVLRKFKITVRRSATVETQLEVRGKDRDDAERRAMAKVKRQPLRVKAAAVNDQIVRTE